MAEMKRSKSSKRRLGTGRIIAIVLLLLLSVALIFNKAIRNTIMAWQTNSYQVENVSKETLEKNKKAKTTFDFGQVESLSTEAVMKAQMEGQQLPVIGGLSIPELDMNLPIFRGLTNASLYFGAGTMKENQVMGEGNYALASHHVFAINGSSKMLFSPLDNAAAGMKVYLTDKEDIYEYTVTSKTIVDPEHVEVVDDVPGQTELTLVTCTDAEATQRVIVKAKFEKKMSYKTADEKIKKSFSKKYNQIQM